MPKILLAFDDVGLGVQLQEALEGRGHQVVWDAAQASGPSDAARGHEAVVLFVDGGAKLQPLVESWLKLEPTPAVIALATHASLQDAITAARARYVPSAADIGELEAAIVEGIKLRFAVGLGPVMAAGAVGYPRMGDELIDAIQIVKRAREADHTIVKEALGRYPQHYVGLNALVNKLREQRALTIPEVELARKLDGTTTLQRALRAGPLDPWQSARFIWALACVGAASLTEDPPDQSTLERRKVWNARFHLRARKERLAKQTFYDVLEVPATATPQEVDFAARHLAIRYTPNKVADIDLGLLRPLVEECWQQIVKAREILIEPGERARYDDWCRSQAANISTEWATSQINPRAALQYFNRAQQALVSGDVNRAMSDMAAACRQHPNHPDYEASLAWARYRHDVAKGKDRDETAAAQRKVAEQALAGRRPWAKGLLALGMLCAAADDPDAASWHLHEALLVDPNLPAAQKLLKRLGGGR